MKFCTRKILNLWICLMLMLFSQTSAEAQNGQFDVRFAVKNFNCDSNKVTIVVQVKAHDAAHTFKMGDANYRFDYDPRVIRNPSIVSHENFSNQPPSSDVNYAPHNLNGSSVGPTIGTVSLNTIYGSGGLGAKTVGTSWMNVACIRFDVQDVTKCIVLDWHTDTEFPVTGMNEVVLSGQNDGNYDQYIVAAGGVFDNYNQCIPSVCAGITALDDINVTNKNTPVSGSAATNDVSSGGAMTFALLSQTTANGNLILNANGTYTYTPANNFVGEHRAVYKVCNAAGVCDTASIVINVLDELVTGVNNAPIAQNDNGQTVVNQPVSGNVLSNDFDPNRNTLTATTTPINTPANGGVVINPDGTYTYTPTNGFVGQDTFRYRVCDNGTPSLCDTAMVVITVGVPKNGGFTNTAPNAQDDAQNTLRNTPVTVAVKANDSDPNGHVLGTPSVTTNPTNGTVVVNADGTITYTPNTNFVGPDQFKYQVCDNGTPSKCDTATVYINVMTEANQPPVVDKTPITTPEDSTKTLCITVTDPNVGQTLTPSVCAGYPLNGTVGSPIVVGNQVCIQYTPTANFNGRDTLCLIVCDNGNPSKCDTAKIPLVVTPVNDAPVVTETPKTIGEDTVVTICQTISDADAGDTHTATLCNQPANGTASTPVIVGNQVCVTYSPTANFNGKDTLCVIVCDAAGKCDTAKTVITVEPRPDAPVVTETPKTVPEDSVVTICQTISDPDAGDTHTATLCSQPAHGTASSPVIVGNQVCVTYSPTANYNGMDTVCIIVCDQTGRCDTSKTVVTVTPRSDAPVVTETPKTIGEDTVATICQTITDSDANDTHTATLCNQPRNGTASTPVIVGNQVCVTYAPTANFNGTDTICIIVCDAAGKCDTSKTVVTVEPRPDAPVVTETPKTVPEDSVVTICQTLSDPDAGDTHTATLCSQPAHGTASSPVIVGNQVCVTYSPTANFNGTDTVCIIVCDQTGRCDTSKTVVTVEPRPDAPIVTETPKTIGEDTTIVICQTISDADAGDTFTATLCNQPANGTASTPIVNGRQVCVTYQPNANFVGTDTVCIIVCDQTGRCDTSKTPIVVENRPDAPVVTETPKTIVEDSTVVICQTLSDADAGDTHTATLCSQPANGSASTPVIVGNQVCVTYVPNANFFGRDTVCIIVCDQTGRCDTSKTPIVVTPKPDAPVVTETPKTIGEDSTVVICQTISDPDAGDTHTATLCSQPANGTASTPVITGNQVCVTYTPTANKNGTDTVCIIVCDQTGRCDTSKTVVTITPKNDPPVVRDSTLTTNNTTPIVVCLPISDPDAGDTHTPTICGQPLSGTVGTPVVSNGRVCVQYIPTSTTTGTQTICVRVCDAAGACDDVILTVNVTPSNRAPIAINDINVTTKNTPTNGTVLVNDSDPDNNTLTPSVITNPRNGQFNLLANGTYSYLPNTNFIGTDTVTYRVCDNGVPSLCDTAIVVIEVRDPNTTGNQKPVANDDNTSTPANRPIVVGVKGNDLDPDANQVLGNPTLVGTPVGGTAVVNPDGTVTFTPTPNFTGPATFQYQVCDNGTPVLCDTATVYVTVYPDPTVVNLPPVANNDAAVTTTTTPINKTVATNDTDPNAGQILTFMPITTPTKGGVVMNADGSYTYTANAGQTGVDSFQYKVCDNGTPSLCDTATVLIQINPVSTGTNLAPVANPDAPSTSTDTPITIVVKSNDYDPNGDPIGNPTITQQPTCGAASVNADGTIRFVPNAGFSGTCSFIYQVCDNNTPALCDTALVTVNVVNTPIGNRPPVAINDYFMGTTGQTLTAKSAATNDSDPDAGQTLSFQQLSLAAKGIVIFNPNGTFNYQPFASFTVGKDSFQYRVCDNASPALCTTAWIVVEYAPAVTNNVAPNANDDNTTTAGTTPLVINVKANDVDQNGNPLSNPTIVTPPTCGTATVNADGTISFVANSGFVGVCTFKYAVCDNGTPALCDTATVSVNVTTPVAVANRAPIANNDETTTGQNQGVIGKVAPNDSDLDAGQTLTFSKVSNPTNGTVQFNADGSFKYQPNPTFVGRDSFRYQVCDNGTPVLCSQAWSVIVVTPTGINQNDAPIAMDDNATTAVNTPVTINVKANDIDPDGTSNTLGNPSIIGTPIGGTATVNPDGTVKFTPTLGFTGTATFQYEVCDNGSPSRCDTATVTVNVVNPPVNNVNLPPVAIDDAKTGVKNQILTGTAGLNDSDPNAGQTLTYTLVSAPANGTLTSLNATTGAFTYTPNNNYVGNDFFVYSICDNGTPSMCDTAVVYLAILDDPCVTVDLKVILEGAYSTQTGLMRTTLNQRGLLPGQTPIGQFAVATQQGHPFKGLPWNYAGTEGDTVTTYPSTVVDWVLVSLRTNATDLNAAWRCAAWLHADGTITIPNKPCVKIPSGSFYILIEHRNHMGVMSPSPVAISNSTLRFDFTSGDSYVLTNPPTFGAKAMSNGKWAMYAGDGKKDTPNNNFDVNFFDSLLWKGQSGTFDQYQYGDFNLDADVNFNDQVLWKTNNGKYSGIQH